MAWQRPEFIGDGEGRGVSWPLANIRLFGLHVAGIMWSFSLSTLGYPPPDSGGGFVKHALQKGKWQKFMVKAFSQSSHALF